ncbi:MAG: HEAT repeat domain-containing protein [Mariprofundaceae bacterium]|nr:HEAT repeat domain-containing protein [Mariprofundaceae bacterium]
MFKHLKKSVFYEKLEKSIHPSWRKVNESLLIELESLFKTWPTQSNADDLQLYQFMIHHLEGLLQFITKLHQDHQRFQQQYAHAVIPEEEHAYILDYAELLGASTTQLIGDRRALKRWFGFDAVVDRYQRKLAQSEQKLAFYLQIIESLADRIVREKGDDEGYKKVWKLLALEKAITPLLSYEGDDRVRIAAFSALAHAVRALPSSMQEHSLNETSLYFIYRSAMDHSQNVWIQCAALNVLKSLSTSSFSRAIRQRLSHPQAGDDLFVRQKAVLLLGENLKHIPSLADLFQTLCQDPSPFVRQSIADSLQFTSDDLLLKTMRQLVLHDPAHQVRAAALMSLLTYLKRTHLSAQLQNIVMDSLLQDSHELTLKTGVQVACRGFAMIDKSYQAQWLEATQSIFKHLHQHSVSLHVRHHVAQHHEQLWCQSTPDAITLKNYFKALSATIYEGQSKKIAAKIIRNHSQENIGRVLAILAQDDFPYELSFHPLWGIRLYKGHRFSFRFWRAWYEFFHPSPDKRQAFSHTVGRSFRGLMHIPSGLMAEVSETKVPGEPVLIASESDWRSYLPLVDELLGCLDFASKKKPLTLYSVQGLTTIHPPTSLIQRSYAKSVLTLNFSHYAKMRNWHEKHMMPANRYLESLRNIGFKIHFQAHEHGGLSPAPEVSRFFSIIPFTGIEFWQRFRDYFLSMYQNSIYDLIFCICMALSGFIGRHFYLSQKLRNTRKQIPLSIGGWGTRGKSGTERLKAGMINALGHHVISKTTGCEALFLHAYPFGKLREMFLFRPYDKATIWEQYNLLNITKGLGAKVFLWECMALTPEYVRIMQRQWMHDDIATITNTHPDHEDLQGPAGINIPQVMTNFIPKNSILLSSEEQMSPILKEESAKQNTKMKSIGWQEAGLLTQDILDRFPYDEHPYNIALVVELGKELGIEPAFALKEMADRVVLDIGVLKVFPKATYHTRTLEFSNGMSANERFGCLGNWQRLGLDRQDIYQEPQTWLSTVVNNRADRVSRSRVFSSILAQDLQVERHFLIGSNLGGFMHDTSDAWHQHITPIIAQEDHQKSIKNLEGIAKKLRIPYTTEHIKDRVQAMLQGIGAYDEPFSCQQIQEIKDLDCLKDSPLEAYRLDIQKEWQQYERTRLQYQTILDGFLAKKDNLEQLNQQLKEQSTAWFQQKFVVIENYHANGEEIIKTILAHTPPGICNRMMGIQNIKGTGLDFVYRWLAWEQCHTDCTKIQSKSKGIAKEGLRNLASFQQFGTLCEEKVTTCLDIAKHAKWAQNERSQAEAQIILSRLEQSMANIQKEQYSQQKTTGLRGWLMHHVETWMDASDAVKRRKTADLIYRDLINERISHERAASELKTLNSRQKGGWLIQRLHLWLHKT